MPAEVGLDADSAARLAFCCCQRVASITFCSQRRRFLLPGAVWSAIIPGNCRKLANVALGCRAADGAADQPPAAAGMKRSSSLEVQPLNCCGAITGDVGVLPR